MKILIAGAGKVGSSLTRELSADGHEIIIIDRQKAVMEAECELYDVMGLEGNCASMQILKDAGAQEADLLIAVTNADELNLLSCATARSLNPKIHTIARIRNPEYIEQAYAMRDMFGLSMIINPERTAAVEIDHLLRFPGFLKRDSFAKGRVEIVEFRLERGSRLIGLALRNIHTVITAHVLVCAVLRGGKAILPKGDFVFAEGDRLFVTAPSENLTSLLRSLGVIKHKVRRAMLCGGGRISYYLAEMLEKNGIDTQIIEQDRQKCEDLAKKLPQAAVVQGDVSNPETLDKEGLRTCDALIALTGMDELNILVSLYAKNLGVPIVVTKQSRTDRMASVVNSMPLGSLISPKDLCSSMILRYVRTLRDPSGQTAVSVQAIAAGQVQASEFIIRKESLHCGDPLASIRIRPNILIAAISRGRDIEIPGGSSSYREGDSVIVISSVEDTIVRFNDIFA